MTLNPFRNTFCQVAGLAFLVASCSSSPKTAASSDATTAIEATQQHQQEALQNQTNVFAPKSYYAASSALNEAKEARGHNASTEKIVKYTNAADASFAKADQQAAVTKTALVGTADSRMAAINAGAQKNYSDEFERADKALIAYTDGAEKGSLQNPGKFADKMNKEYRVLEINGTIRSKLGDADKLIMQAKEEGAIENAPKTYKSAVNLYAQAVATIRRDPRNSAAVDTTSTAAQKEAEKLVRVERKTKSTGGAKSEDLVLRAEAQQGVIAEQNQMIQEVADQRTEAQEQTAQAQQKVDSLQGSKDLQDKIASISGKFDKTEADVYQQGKKVIIRLKGVQFALNDAKIPSSSYDTLKKVEQSVQEFDNPHVTIQGNTDSTGSQDVNQPLSQKRAESVKNYLTANLQVPGDKIEAKGFGSTNPVTSNKTAAGRAKNRRIDVVIETL